jgi:hypothetical protein
VVLGDSWHAVDHRRVNAITTPMIGTQTRISIAATLYTRTREITN